MPQSEVYLKNIFAIVTDEVHVIPKWQVQIVQPTDTIS